MHAAAEAIAQGIPDALRHFVREVSGVPLEALHMLHGDQVPEPAKRLLVHDRDMTSTLAEFHGSPLRVDVLQQRESDDVYLREVFLRSTDNDGIVEYGVIAIALDQFAAAPRAAIRAGRTPLGAVLHQFQIAFQSRPLGFFSVAPSALVHARFEAFRGAVCHGRFNRLAKPSGEPLAWIMEILPPAKA